MPKIGNSVTKAGLLALRPGMSQEEVIRLIGRPLYKQRTYQKHKIGEAPQWNGEWSWIYGEQGFWGFGAGFEISIGIKGGRLVGAGAERFDLGVWWCNQRECPVVWDAEALSRLE